MMMLRSFGGHPTCILSRRVKRPFLLTKSKALVRSMNAIYSGCLCSRHFSCSCPRENTMLMVDRLALKPHCASGYTLSARVCSLFKTTRAKCFPNDAEKRYPSVVVAIASLPFVFIQCDDVGITHVLGYASLLPTL